MRLKRISDQLFSTKQILIRKTGRYISEGIHRCQNRSERREKPSPGTLLPAWHGKGYPDGGRGPAVGGRTAGSSRPGGYDLRERGQSLFVPLGIDKRDPAVPTFLDP